MEILTDLVDPGQILEQRRRREPGERFDQRRPRGRGRAADRRVIAGAERTVAHRDRSSNAHPTRLQHAPQYPCRMMRWIVDAEPQFLRLRTDPDRPGQAHDGAVGRAVEVDRGRAASDGQRAVFDRIIRRQRHQRRLAHRSRGHRHRQLVIVERQRGGGRARSGRDVVPAHPRAPALIRVQAVVADNVAHDARLCRDRIGERGEAIRGAIRRARQPCVAMPFEDHVARATTPLDPHSRAANGIRRSEVRQRPERRRRREHLGVRRRDEALVGVDRDHLRAVLINHDQAEARAGCGGL